jgi:cytochrome b6-f complex iron-sulfur subunit
VPESEQLSSEPQPLTETELLNTERPTAASPPAKPGSGQAKRRTAAATDGKRRGLVAVLFGSFLATGFTTLASALGLFTLGMVRFMLPNIQIEPPSRFKIGFPSDYAPGTVETRFKSQYGIWVVHTQLDGQRQIVALKAVCTHLGCTPNWLEAEQKFKCPCHGSGFYKDGVNFEGPAPRPLERYAIRLADDGQLEVDKGRTFHEELGQWRDPDSYYVA